MNPDPWRLLKRKERLMQVRSEEAEERKIRKMSAIKDDKPYSDTILTANITTTDFRSDFTIKKDKIADNEPSGSVLTSFERQETGEVISDDGGSSKDNKQATYSDLEKQFLNVRWLYDTPGVIKTEQIVNLLKPEEVKRITPKKRLIPRVFMLKPGEVMFISGLSRLDYIQGNQLIYITVFTNLHLPVHTTTIEEADTYYDKHIGGATFQVPLDTMDHLPSLIGRYFELTGSGTKESTSDIQLSSLGWISVAVQRDEQIGLRAYTPGGQGCFLREKSFLPNYKKFQGLRIKGTNKYKWKIPSV